MASFRISTDLAGWRRHLSLRAELATGFIAMIVLTLAVGIVSLAAQDRSSKSVNSLVDVVGRIADLSLGSNVAMLKARRAEKDFLIFKNAFGFQEARSRYVTLLRTGLAEVRQGMAELRGLSADAELNRLTRSIETAVDEYEAGFLKTVDMYRARGHVSTGFAGALGNRARAIEAIVEAAHDDRLMIDLLGLRRQEKDFIERGTETHIRAFAAGIERLKADIARARLPPAVKSELLEITYGYEGSFGEFVRVEADIDAEQAVYLAAAHRIEPLLEKLHADAELNAYATRNKAGREARIAFWTICAALLLASLLGLAVAGVISRRITRSVDECLGFARRVAEGHLSTRLLPKGESEFGTLAVALNSMTQALQERDTELNQSNELLQQGVERAEYLAYYDGLTALPNRGLFSRLLKQAIGAARGDAKQVAVLFIDLDRFKNINDTLGHKAGDLLLQEIAGRLRDCLRAGDTVARLGGDEFVVLLPALDDAAYVDRVARGILAAASKPFVALGQEFRVSASVGISVFPKDGDDEGALMKNADIAMYRAKQDGKNGFQFYSPQMNTHSYQRLAMEEGLRHALQHDEFVLHYQPKIAAHSGAIVGTEALLRWQHPELGAVAPAAFLPVAEETGLIVSIGRWVLKTACSQNMAWQRDGAPAMKIAVNLSARQFADENLIRDLEAVLAETGMDAALLELELTESTLMHDVGKAIPTLKAFRDMGLRLAVDDFGTGYAALSSLGRFPIDTIKIDGSFARDIAEHPETSGIAQAIIAMGKALSLTLVAEGVETRAHAELLAACDEFQGFYFSKAVGPAEIAALLSTTALPAAA